MMAIPIRRTTIITASIVVPFLIQAPLIILHKELNQQLTPYQAGGLADVVLVILGCSTFYISTCAGLALLIREFGWPSAYVVLLVYVPIIFGLLMLFSIGVIGQLYGDYL
jgi:hypothetical protein